MKKNLAKHAWLAKKISIKSESSPPPLRALRPLREKNMLAKHAGLAKKISIKLESSPSPLRALRPLREKYSRKARRARKENAH
ncbi:MAG: hypothetical protein IPG01_08845 [Chitinophagaceae bacterium]|nr:hypothetical protein [Chitinophagaceae bacterium]